LENAVLGSDPKWKSLEKFGQSGSPHLIITSQADRVNTSRETKTPKEETSDSKLKVKLNKGDSKI